MACTGGYSPLPGPRRVAGAAAAASSPSPSPFSVSPSVPRRRGCRATEAREAWDRGRRRRAPAQPARVLREEVRGGGRRLRRLRAVEVAHDLGERGLGGWPDIRHRARIGLRRVAHRHVVGRRRRAREIHLAFEVRDGGLRFLLAAERVSLLAERRLVWALFHHLQLLVDAAQLLVPPDGLLVV